MLQMRHEERGSAACTRRGTFRVRLTAGLIVALGLGTVLLPSAAWAQDPCPPVTQCADAGSSSSGFEITLVDGSGNPTTSGSFDGVNTTFRWKVCRPADGCPCTGGELSHLTLSLAGQGCANLVVVSSFPVVVQTTDPTCFPSQAVVKWDEGFESNCNPPQTCETYEITFAGFVPTGVTQMGLKGPGEPGDGCGTLSVLGPACESCGEPTSTETPTETPTNTPTVTDTPTETPTNTSIGMAAMDGDIDVVGTQGLVADFDVVSFTRTEPLEEVLKVAVSVKPTYSVTAPEWTTVAAGS